VLLAREEIYLLAVLMARELNWGGMFAMGVAGELNRLSALLPAKLASTSGFVTLHFLRPSLQPEYKRPKGRSSKNNPFLELSGPFTLRM
jgi:hypothetical protein